MTEDQEAVPTLNVDATNPSGCRLCEALLESWPSEPNNHQPYLDLQYELQAQEGFFFGVLDVIFKPTPQLGQATRTGRFGLQLHNETEICTAPLYHS